MRVLVAAFGTRGDVQPAVVAARALEAAGHRCECFVPPNLVGWVRELGLQATGLGLDYAAVSQAASEGRFIDLLRVLPQLRRELDLQVDALGEAAKRADLVLGLSVFAAGQLLSDLNDIPYRFLALSPVMLPSPEHPSPAVPFQRLPRFLNRLSWTFNEPLWNLYLRAPLNRRRRALGLSPVRSLWGELVSRAPLLATEPLVFPAGPPLAPGRPPPITALGGLFLEEDRPVSPEVDAFLRAGPPPVYVGFGSMSDARPQRTVKLLLEAARAAGLRLLLSRGWASFELDAALARGDALLIGPEPHLALFPRCAAVVHHGGAGTAHAALRSGVPQVVVPHMLDQYYTARRLELAGVGVGLKGRRGLSAEPLAAALKQVQAPERVERARELGTRVARDGARRLVEALTATR